MSPRWGVVAGNRRWNEATLNISQQPQGANMGNRRSFLKSVGVLGVSSLTWPDSLFNRSAVAAAVASTLNARQIPKFVNTLPNPLDPGFVFQPDVLGGTQYTLQIEEFSQNLGLGLLDALGQPVATTVWGYGKTGQAPTFPGRTFEVQQGTPITVTYVNNLVDPLTGDPLPNRMPVDTTLDWANPGALGGLTPVPAVAHLHGGDSQYLSDGLPDAWATPFEGREGATTATGAVIASPQQGRLFSKPYTYDNNQEAGTLWYHDHALGITRTNVYMGLAGFYLLRDANENSLRVPAVAGGAPVLPSHPYEIPIVIQDREFASDGSLYYPASAPQMPSPTHLPEFFGSVVLVNGQAWPKLDVEPRKYRLRLLNGSDSRFYDLRFERFAPKRDITPGAGKPLQMLVIGNELGLLDQPAVPALDGRPGIAGVPGVLAIGPGERYDLVVDFSNVPAGSRIVVTNSARSPYPDATLPANGLTDRLMAFDVVLPPDTAVKEASVSLGTPLRPLLKPLGNIPKPKKLSVRRIMLFEGTDVFGRLQTMLGPVDADPNMGLVGTLTFRDPITERPKMGSTEIWEFYNTTVDAHPLHMHLVEFRVLSRQAFTGTIMPKVNSDGSDGGVLDPASIALVGAAVAPSAWESGGKDTVKTFPGEVTRVLVNFKRKGEYVYHCHILSHEDHEMMRPYEVV
jgi:spore coat protein A